MDALFDTYRTIADTTAKYPFDYEVVGPVVNEFVEKGKSPNDLIESFKAVELVGHKYPEGLYSRYDAESFAKLVNGLYRKMNQSVYKRVQAAPIVVVSERASGRREPPVARSSRRLGLSRARQVRWHGPGFPRPM